MDSFKKIILYGSILICLFFGGCSEKTQRENEWIPSSVASLAKTEESEDLLSEEVLQGEKKNIPQKCLVIGNSITLGFGTHGMASSDVDTDFYYLVKEHLTLLNPNLQMKRVDGRPWESCTTTESRKVKLETILADDLEEDTDLVIIQLGDNVNTAEKIETFSSDCNVMLNYIMGKCPNARILWVFGRYNLGNADAIRAACQSYGAEYVDISIVSTDAKYMSYMGAPIIGADGNTEYIDNGGVASHPGDEGMRVIADLIIEALDLYLEE